MGKLHEVLAVEDSLATIYRDMLNEAQNTFTKKGHLFSGLVSKQTTIAEDGQSPTGGVYDDEEVKPVAETVPGKLRYVGDHAANYFDALAQKEITNTRATADLVVDGNVLITAAPATLLLALENKLKAIRGVVLHAPTLDPAISWKPAENEQEIYTVEREDTKLIFLEFERHKVVIQPTDRQPGQYATYKEKVPVAKKTVVQRSGAISPRQKSNLMGRIDKLIMACKRARNQANEAVVEPVQIGRTLIDYILQD